MTELQQFAYDHPLTRATALLAGHTRMVRQGAMVALTVNK